MRAAAAAQLENCKGSYKVGAVVFNDAMTDELEKSVEQVRGFPQSEEDLAVSRALFASFRGVTREAWLRRFVEMDIYKVAKAFDLGPQAPEFSQKYASLPRFVAKAAYEAHCGEGYGYGRVEATLRRQAKRTRQRLSWKDRSQAYLDGGWATWRVESGRPVHVRAPGRAPSPSPRPHLSSFSPPRKPANQEPSNPPQGSAAAPPASSSSFYSRLHLSFSQRTHTIR